MTKLYKLLAVSAVTLTLAACQSSGSFTGLSSISDECRTAGSQCMTSDTVENNRVVVDQNSTNKAKRVFDYSQKK